MCIIHTVIFIFNIYTANRINNIKWLYKNSFFLIVARRKNCSNTGKTWTGRTKISTIFKVTRDGGAVEAKNGGAQSGEKPGTKLTAHLKCSVMVC